jgi:predicted dehydrogenase
MTNFGAHDLDIAQWALDMDNSGPVAIEGTAEFHPDRWYEVTMKCRLTYTYANGVKLVVGQQQDDLKKGVTFIGTKGTVFVDRKQIVSTPEGLAKEPLKAGDVRLYESANHHQNFLDCVKSRKLPICDVEIGHRSATVCHLGNIALWLGRKLQWDPVAEAIVGDEEAARMLSRPYRRPWA